jgi:hypothetical protein
MTSDQVIAFIRDVGFPIAVAAFLLYRVDPLLRQVRDALFEQNLLLQQLCNALARQLDVPQFPPVHRRRRDDEDRS